MPDVDADAEPLLPVVLPLVAAELRPAVEETILVVVAEAMRVLPLAVRIGLSIRN